MTAKPIGHFPPPSPALPPLGASLIKRLPVLDLFWPYQAYFDPNIRLPIDALNKLGKKMMVIQPSRKDPQSFLTIFKDKEGIPFMKVVSIVDSRFKCQNTVYNTFRDVLREFNADVTPLISSASSLRPSDE